MKAEIISIGTELLLGQITDTNASYLASKLPELGIDLYWVTQVGDNLERMRECLERAWNRSDLVLTSGGLGPTEDDLTREAIAALMGEEPAVDARLEQAMREFFAARGYSMPESNVKQATLIPSAQSIPNPRGTAPGWWVERDGRIIVAMPGPPGEMQRMWEKEVSLKLRAAMPEVIVSRMLKTYLLAEAAVGEMVSQYLSSPNPSLAVYAKPDGIQLRLTAKAESRPEAEQMIARLEERVRGILGDSIWGCDDETLESVVGVLLTERGLTLATMESCTGGLLASMITDVPGSSDYFKGGLVSYSNDIKIAYGVDAALLEQHGAVSPEVAGAMAEAVRARLGADIGVAITGVAGPDAVEGQPVGTAHIAIDDGVEKRLVRGVYPPLRPEVKRRAANHALFELRRVLLSR